MGRSGGLSEAIRLCIAIRMRQIAENNVVSAELTHSAFFLWEASYRLWALNLAADR
jgi:hypothetical protein